MSERVTPELALVDPGLAVKRNGSQASERKGAMSSNPPPEGTFFVDQPAAQPPVDQPAVPAPAPEPAPAPTPESVPSAVEAAALPDSSSMRDVPLGTLIFRAGLLAEEQLEDALQEGMRTGKRLGEVLLERGWLHERDLGRMLAGQKGLPFVELAGLALDPAAVQLLPEENARLQSAIAIGFEAGVPVVAVADPTNDLVLENLHRALGAEPRLVVAAYGDLQRKVAEAYGALVAAPSLAPPVSETEPAVQAPAPEPQPASVVEPLSAAPVVAPMPTTLPPAESRAPEAPVVAEKPVPVAEVPVVVSGEPAAEQQTPAAPPPAVETPPAQPFAAEPPQAYAAPQPAPAPEAPAPAPAVPAPVPEAPGHVPPLTAGPPAAPTEPETAHAPPQPSEPSANGVSTPAAATHFVVVRLREGEHLEIGSFGGPDDARRYAQEVVRQIAAAEGESTWPFFAGRFLRPETIVSVDIVEESIDRWRGSATRARWAAPAE